MKSDRGSSLDGFENDFRWVWGDAEADDAVVVVGGRAAEVDAAGGG
jgi:hypothetical protein